MVAESNEERLENMFLELVVTCTDPKKDLKKALEEVMVSLHRHLGFRQIAVAIRDSKNGTYRYNTFMGFTHTAVSEYKKIEYNYDDLFDNGKYPRIRISDSIHFFPSEFSAYQPGEEGTFNHPSKLGKKREIIDEMLEDDYIDVFIYSHERKCLGWLEVAGTPNGKLPSRQSIRWLEMIASLLGKTIISRNL